MLHRMTVIAKAGLSLGAGALNGELGRVLACLMKSCTDRQITGALVLDSGHYMAALEGETDELRAILTVFEGYAAHSNFHMLEYVPAVRREFRTWSVGALRAAPGPSRLVRKFQTIVPTAGEVRTQVRTVIARGVLAESPPLVGEAA